MDMTDITLQGDHAVKEALREIDISIAVSQDGTKSTSITFSFGYSSLTLRRDGGIELTGMGPVVLEGDRIRIGGERPELPKHMPVLGGVTGLVGVAARHVFVSAEN